MNCQVCGEVCRCQLEPPPYSLTQREPSAGIDSAPLPSFASDAPCAAETAAALDPQNDTSNDASEDARDDAGAWRNELSLRLNHYRSRRKVRPPRYPSLNLPFEASEFITRAPAPPPDYAPVSDHALALDDVRHAPALDDTAHSETLSAPAPERIAPSAPAPAPHASAKILEFPRFAWGPPAPPPDQLAEPVSERPRILEVPEVAPAPPALGGITIEAAKREEVEKRPGIDIPLQSAPFPLRVVAALTDGAILSGALALFAYIFWRVAAFRPPTIQIAALAVGMAAILWAAYQYLLIVYAGTTPGLRAAGLHLSLFDGSMPRRRLRRWRVLASYLSALSLGMGYAWVFLDEDSLCWHDRITHTYLAPSAAAVPQRPPSI